jgi:preprotein translocase subunit YajC
MIDLCSYCFPILFAEDPVGGSLLQTLIAASPLLFAFYFIFIWPQQRSEQKRRAMLETIKKNDKVLTTGGMYATVVSIDAAQDKVVLRVDDDRGVKLAFTRASIARVIDASSEKTPEKTTEST